MSNALFTIKVDFIRNLTSDEKATLAGFLNKDNTVTIEYNIENNYHRRRMMDAYKNDIRNWLADLGFQWKTDYTMSYTFNEENK